MTLLYSTHTLNLIFLSKSFRGAGPPPLKRPRGGPYTQAPLIRACAAVRDLYTI